MMNRFVMCWVVFLTISIGLSASHARGGGLETVNWVSPNPVADEIAGTGSGTLGSDTVGYTTVPGGLGNAATTIGDNWNANLATAGAVGSGASNLTGGVLGTVPGPGNSTPNSIVENISFSGTVIDPVLLLNYTDANTSMSFGNLSLSVLSSNNAQLTGDLLTFTGSSNSFNDGVALQINGTFGPTQSLTFYYTEITPSVSNFDSVGFTIGQAVPEPSAFVLGLASIVGMIGLGLRRRARLAR